MLFFGDPSLVVGSLDSLLQQSRLMMHCDFTTENDSKVSLQLAHLKLWDEEISNDGGPFNLPVVITYSIHQIGHSQCTLEEC